MSKKKVLIVEDDKDFLEILSECLSISSRPFIARTEAQALDILQREELDAVICDISLGSGSGITLLERCRKQNINVPFVMMTGDVKKEHVLAALRLGAKDVIQKPFSLDYLENKFLDIANKSFSLRKIKSGLKEVGTLVGATLSAEDLDFVHDYLFSVEASRLLRKQKRS